MGSLFKKSKKSAPAPASNDGVIPYYPNPAMAPPEYFELFQLAGNDQLAALKRALAKMPPTTAQLQLGPQSMLHCAAQNGAENVVPFLLSQGLDKNQRTTGTGVTPLLYAVRGGHHKVAETLLKAGASPELAVSNNDPKYPGLTALHFAVAAGDAAMVRLLLANSANPAQTDGTGLTPLDLAQRMGHQDMVKLLSSGATANQDSDDPEELARIASNQGRLEDGLAMVGRIEALVAGHGQDKIDGCVAMVAINLASKATSGDQARQCLALLSGRKVMEEMGIQANLSNALRHAASNARPAATGYEIAQVMKTLPLFNSNQDFREAYGNTLFNISVVAEEGRQCYAFASEIMQMPDFATSPHMHFDSARILSNAAGLASNGEEARGYAGMIAKMPLFARIPQLQEASDRAFRNCRRFD